MLVWCLSAGMGVAVNAPGGSHVAFVGFVGAQEEYALVYVTPFRPNVEPAVLYLVPMQGDAMRVQWPVPLHASVLAEHPSPKTFHEYYLFRLAKVQRTQLGDRFVEASARLAPLPGREVIALDAAGKKIAPTGAVRPTAPETPMPAPTVAPPRWSTSDEAVFSVGPNEHVGLRIVVQDQMTGARPFEVRRGYACAEWENDAIRLHCESCSLQQLPTGLGTRTVPLCRTTAGRLTRNVPGHSAKIWPRGIKCDCGATAYQWVPELRWNDMTRQGIATLAMPTDADPAIFQQTAADWGPPTLAMTDGAPDHVTAYRNGQGHVIVVGAAVRAGPQYVTQFPLLAVIPQPSSVVTPPADAPTTSAVPAAAEKTPMESMPPVLIDAGQKPHPH